LFFATECVELAGQWLPHRFIVASLFLFLFPAQVVLVFIAVAFFTRMAAAPHRLMVVFVFLLCQMAVGSHHAG